MKEIIFVDEIECLWYSLPMDEVLCNSMYPIHMNLLVHIHYYASTIIEIFFDRKNSKK